MNTPTRANTLQWIARILAIAYLLFFSLFALDAFSGDASLVDKAAGFLIHMLPSLCMAIVLALFWKRPAVLGWVYIALSIVFTIFFNTWRQSLGTFAIISLPPLLIGGLFLLSAATGGEQPS